MKPEWNLFLEKVLNGVLFLIPFLPVLPAVVTRLTPSTHRQGSWYFNKLTAFTKLTFELPPFVIPHA